MTINKTDNISSLEIDVICGQAYSRTHDNTEKNNHQSNVAPLRHNTEQIEEELDEMESSLGNSMEECADDFPDYLAAENSETDEWADDSTFDEDILDDDPDEDEDENEDDSPPSQKKKHKPRVNPENLLTQEEKNSIAEENYRMIFHMAKKFRNTHVDPEEIEGWAQMGFAKALDKFDKSKAKAKKVKVTTFIMSCMYSEIKFNLRKQRAIMRSAQELSLDATVMYNNDETDLPISDGIAYNDIVKNGGDISYIETDLLNVEKTETVKKLITRIPKREQAILILSFGLFGHSCMTQEEIGEELNMSQANVSKVKGDALRRMGMILELECRREQRRNNNKNNKRGGIAY